MKKTKKLISILITVCMLMTTVSLSFTAFGAASNAQYNDLIAALSKESVAKSTANFSTGGRTGAFTKAPNDLVAAMDAYLAVYNATRPTNFPTGSQAAAPRVINTINNDIKTKLQSKMGADYTTYNVAAVITDFSAGLTVADTTSTSKPNNTAVSNQTVTITITLDDEEVFAPYDTLEALKSAGTVNNVFTYTFPSASKSYSVTTGSGCNEKTTTYYYYVADAASKSQKSTVDLTKIMTLAADIETYAAYFSYTLNDFVALTQNERTAAINNLGAHYAAVSAFAVAKYFPQDVNGVVNGLTDANTIVAKKPLAEKLAALYDTDYSAYTLKQLQDFYQEYLTAYNEMDACNATVKNYYTTDKFNAGTLAAKKAEILKALQLFELKTLKNDQVDPAVAEYSAWDEDDYFGDTLTKNDIVLAKGEIEGYIRAIDTYDIDNVLEVFGAQGLEDLDDLVEALAGLIDIADADDAFATQYSYFVSTVYAAMDYDASSAELFEGVKKYDTWFTELKAFETELVETYGEITSAKIFEDLADEMNTKLNEKYEILNTRLSAEIGLAYGLLEEIKDIYGGEVTILSVETYGYLQDAIGGIESDIFDFLDASANYALSDELKAEYEELGAVVFDEYEQFLETAGFDKYQQSFIGDFIRKAVDDEKVRNEDYTVDDAMVEEIIDLIEKILQSDELKALGVDLASMLTPDLLEGLYSDSVINSIVQYVYPVVAKEFAKVWADLPTNVEADNPIGDGKLNVKLSLLDLTSAMKNIQFFIFPGLLADNIKNQYPAVAEVLKKATTKPVYHMDTDEMDNPWEDAAICNEDGTLALTWGIDEAEDKETAFLNAAQAALSGLEPLLMALVSNKGINGKHTGSDNDIAKDGKPGHGKVGTGSTSIKILISISVTVDPINLFLDISGNEGYNNAIVPIFEALGLDPAAIPDGNSFNTVTDVLKLGLIEPVKALLSQMAAAPVDFVLKALPNLAYALQTGRIVPLLSMLKTDINYHADAHYSAVAGLAAGDIDEALSDGPISINIGEMIDLEDLGLDLSNFNALLSLVAGLLGEDVTLPRVDAPILATLGELTWKDTKRSEKTYAFGPDGQAAYIEANRADVLVFLFDYVISALKAQPTLIEDIVNAVQASKAEEEAAAAAEAGEEYVAPEPFVMPEAVTQIINNVIAGYEAAENKFDALAALAELVHPVEYATEAATLVYDSTALDPDYEIKDLHTGEVKVVFDSEVEYTEWWTQEKAQYVADNLTSFIDNIIMMLGVKIGDVKVESLAETVDNLVASLYTAETVNELAATLNGLFDGLDIDEALKGFLMNLIAENIGDISVWDGYTADFEDGDKDAFVAALTEVLEPAEKLLQFILTDDNITISLNGEEGAFRVFELAGHEGYTYGLVPLFEALGATPLAPADFIADKDNIIANILTPLVEVIDNISADPTAALQSVVPNLLYFIQAGGIQVAMDNLLYSVNQALDVIKPIYDVDLNGLLGFDLSFADVDPVQFLLTKAEEMLYEATGVEFELDYNAADLLKDLTFGTMETYTSAAGNEAYRIVPGNEASADMITNILRFVVGEIAFSDNTVKLAELVRDQFELPDEAYIAMYAFLLGLNYMKDTHVDYALGIMFYAFYGANTAVEAMAEYYKYYAYDWQEIAETVNGDDLTDLQKAQYVFEQIYYTTGMTILDTLYEEGKSPVNSSIIAQLIDLFTKFIKLFKELFSQIGAKLA